MMPDKIYRSEKAARPAEGGPERSGRQLTLVVGKSGSGKNYLLEAFGMSPIPSFTTRPMRPGEADGREHRFVTDAEWKSTPRDSVFANTLFHGNAYWTTFDDARNEAYDAYVVDPNGVYDILEALNSSSTAFNRRLRIIVVIAPLLRRLARMVRRARPVDGWTPPALVAALKGAVSRAINDRREFAEFEYSYRYWAPRGGIDVWTPSSRYKAKVFIVNT